MFYEYVSKVVYAHHVWAAPHVTTELGLPTVITVKCTDLMGLKKGPCCRELASSAARNAGGLIAISRRVMAEAILSVIKAGSETAKGQYANLYALADFSWSGQVAKMIEPYQPAIKQ
ncbi:MAG: hypothetical protein BMS9Abin02_0730 [Anaerolineae bacterium]|nr:MAG: hypothetical protein BMS9Abin02_0730 [Anaerolineae bacterium]